MIDQFHQAITFLDHLIGIDQNFVDRGCARCVIVFLLNASRTALAGIVSLTGNSAAAPSNKATLPRADQRTTAARLRLRPLNATAWRAGSVAAEGRSVPMVPARETGLISPPKLMASSSAR